MINLLLRTSSLTFILILLTSLLPHHSEQSFHEELFKKKYDINEQQNQKQNKQNNQQQQEQQSQSSDSQKSQKETTTETSDLELSINIDTNPITRGNEQTITVNIIDKDSKEELSGIEINGFIKYASRTTTKSFSGITDSDGKLSHSWKIGENSKPGLFEVMVKAKSPLDNTSILEGTERFEVKSKS